jgi:hypothetical protein
MSYGEKFKLVFSDRYNNPRKLSILQKNYSGSVKDLIGTGDPVTIKWHNKDNIYNPIIGSTCEINLLVTESTGGIGWDDVEDNWNLSEVEWSETTGTQGTDYDNWYESDEREYKVRISTGDLSGSPKWDNTTDQWQTSAVDWDDPDAQGFEFYWEGFLIVDAYQEPYTTTPYPIKLIASDGLGLLDGFDAPDSNIVYTTPPTIDVSDGSQSNFDSAFYYVRKILENTGLDLDIFIANNIRKSTYSSTDQDTILHDISIFEYGVVNNSNLNLTAKDLLTKILNSINSRIFQSQGRFYIVSNSNLIDQRIFESRETTPVSTPVVQNLHITTTENVPTEFELYGFDAQGLSLTWNITDDVDNGSTSLSGSTVTYTPTTDYVGGDKLVYTATNGTNTSVTAFVSIKVIEAPVVVETGTKALVLPYNVEKFTAFYGTTLEQCFRRMNSYLNFARTNTDQIVEPIKFEPNFDVGLFSSNFNVVVSVGAGQSDGSDPLSWRWAQVGSKVLYHIVPRDADSYGYRPENNTSDPDIGGGLFKYPNSADFDNGAFVFPDGYMGFTTPAFIRNDFRLETLKTQYASKLGITLNDMPRVNDFNQFPQELKDVIPTPANLNPIGRNIRHIVRIESGIVVELRLYASE